MTGGPYKAGCPCGAVQLELSGEPAVQVYCHCNSCRTWLGAPIHGATLWPTTNVKVVKGADNLGRFITGLNPLTLALRQLGIWDKSSGEKFIPDNYRYNTVEVRLEILRGILDTDGSVDIIRKYEERLSGWVSEKDRGQGDAINKGLARAKGEIVAWLNSDDYYLPKAISSAVHAFQQNPDAALVYGNMLAVDGSSQTLNLLKYGQYSLEDLLCFQIIGQPAVFFCREAYEKAGGLDVSLHYMLDHHLWIRIAARGRLIYVPQAWAAARFHPQAKNRNLAVEFPREAFRILDWAKDQPDLSPYNIFVTQAICRLSWLD